MVESIKPTTEFAVEAATPPLAAPDGGVEVAELPERTLWGDAWRRFRKHRLARLGLVVYLFLIALVIAGPFLWRVSISDIDFAASNVALSPGHPMGTDDLGR